MKSIFIIFCFYLLISILSGCNEQDDPKSPVPPISLFFPIHGDTVNYCCFTFEWATRDALTDVKLTLAEDNQFSNMLLDTFVEINNLRLVQKLKPGQKYYWKVRSEILQEEAIDSFLVKDYVKYFEGNYAADVRIEDWNFVNGVTWDTMYTGNIDIIWSAPDTVEIFEHTTAKRRTFVFFPSYDANENTILYFYNDVSRSSFCTFNYVTNEFWAGVIEGGVGSRRNYYFSGNK